MLFPRTSLGKLRETSELAAAARRFAALTDAGVADDAAGYHAVVSGMHDLCAAICRAERAFVSSDEIAVLVEPARALHATSPFVRRLQTWPRGYPGDFETIEYLCESIVRAEPSSIGYFIELHCLQGASAQQHRNKVAWQAELMVHMAGIRPRARILSIACGASPDVRSIQRLLANTDCRVYLNDLDSDALSYSFDRLPLIRSQVAPVAGDAFNIVRKLKALGPFDLIVAGGLFDYLTDHQLTWLLPRLFAALDTNGKLCFTNIATGNRDRVWLEYLAGWHLIERSEHGIRELICETGILSNAQVQIARDGTGLTHLVQLTRR